ncbi:hypothetical protein KBD45_03370 [Candidatus Dojkabacteria bacterium]|nr:hypothetical protein [Candidatus Dojkabacteria bacterium]
MKRVLTIILTIGIILRIFLASTTYHSDTAPFDFAGKIIGSGNALNFYDYLWDLPEGHPYLKIYPRNLFNYPPLPYFFLGSISLVTTWVIDPVVHENFILDFESTLGNAQLNLLLLLLKLPYFIFDIAIAYLLMSLFKDKKEKLWIFALWIFNPVNLYATYMIGQFDIIPTFLTVLAIYLTTKTKYQNLLISAVLLGIGAGFKIFPLLLIVPLALIKPNFWERVRLILVSGITYILFAYPFIWSEGFRMTAALANQTTKSFYANIPVSGGESIILFLAVVIFMYFVFYFAKVTLEDVWKNFFLMLLVFFVFTHFHPQWLLWMMPFYMIDLVVSKFKHWPLFLVVMFSFVALVTFFDPGLTVWLFAPINPGLYGQVGIWQQLGLNIDINQARSVFHTIFVGTSLYYIYHYFPKKKD